MPNPTSRIGVDFGGTKIEAALIAPDGGFTRRLRQPNPGGYEPALALVREMGEALDPGGDRPVGVAAPGSPSLEDGRMRNANSTWLNGRAFAEDLESELGRRVRVANDANCFALSEALSGAARGYDSVFGVILGTGCGGGLVSGGRLTEGANGVAGEWGHIPLPHLTDRERPGHQCWCGRGNCLETWISGPAFTADYEREAGERAEPVEIVRRALEGEPEADAALDRLIDRIARGLSVIVNVFDPHAIVLGGGLSNIEALYERLPGALRPHVFSDIFETKLLRHQHGDSSGVRGAAWLWD